MNHITLFELKFAILAIAFGYISQSFLGGDRILHRIGRQYLFTLSNKTCNLSNNRFYKSLKQNFITTAQNQRFSVVYNRTKTISLQQLHHRSITVEFNTFHDQCKSIIQ